MKSASIHAGILCIALGTALACAEVTQYPDDPPESASAVAVVVEQIRPIAAPARVVSTPEPPLNVEALKTRLRETRAIGIFAKLALSNQMDDLVQEFRSHHLGGHNTSVAGLRQRYDLLVLKVLALIQDGDPPLARTIAGSREAIWSILADPEQFKSVG
ncbi:MAG: hypothetical protein Q8M11_15385 [Sulfuritalea sp.]|jgi:hypothetical protein|nr:hypothetical protein [Sulfuritalea sp.]MDP1983113.1 hypothetical protein [Sulfuritalea sp.]